MTDSRAQYLIDGYDTHNTLIHRFAAGIGHEQSVQAPPFPASTFNWLVGHILSGRDEAIQVLGQPPLWTDDSGAKYQTGSPPLTDPVVAVPLPDLLTTLDRSRGLLQIALESSSAEYLNEIIDTRFGPRPRIDHVSGLQWHETYHLGQLEMLRSMLLNNR